MPCRSCLPLLVLALALLVPDLAFAASDGDSSMLVTAAKNFAPIAILLVVVGFVFARLPKIELGHSPQFMRRRVMNWLPLGLTYAFLYMARYNLKVSKFTFENMADPTGGSMMSNADFGTIFFYGTVTYGCSFVLNGPLTDRFGGKFSILVGAGGSALMNLVMGFCTLSLIHDWTIGSFVAKNFVVLFSILYSVNMYFQSFGAVAIVKVNAPWFHVRERGVFGAIFGILISLGIYFAFDVGYMILNSLGVAWVFLMPAILLGIFWVLDVFLVRNTPGEAGLEDFDTADASSGDDGPRLPVAEVFKKMLTNPVILTIAGIEFCSGFLRQAIMQYYRIFSKATGTFDGFVPENWGMLLCCAGIIGGVFAGVISDRVFDSRRGPVAAVLYLLMIVGSGLALFFLGHPFLGVLVVFMSMCIIGVHGMLSGTASMDFGGKKNVGVAVGIIDGFVYLGTGFMAALYSVILPDGEAAKEVANWAPWPLAMIPMAIIGFALATRIWNAKPKGKAKAAH